MDGGREALAKGPPPSSLSLFLPYQAGARQPLLCSCVEGSRAGSLSVCVKREGERRRRASEVRKLASAARNGCPSCGRWEQLHAAYPHPGSAAAVLAGLGWA